MQCNLIHPVEGLKRLSENWHEAKDGNLYALSLFHRHYSYKPYKDGRSPVLFVGPGSKLVLLMRGGLFVWRKFISGDGQKGVNCSIFRNETNKKSSNLILEAEGLAVNKWGESRAFTYVSPKKIKSINPGYCFKVAGWNPCGTTKVNKLLILEKHLKAN